MSVLLSFYTVWFSTPTGKKAVHFSYKKRKKEDELDTNDDDVGWCPRSASVFLEKRVEKKSRWRDVKAKGKGHTGLTEGWGAGSLLSLDEVALQGDGEKRSDGLEVEKASVPVWRPPSIGCFWSLIHPLTNSPEYLVDFCCFYKGPGGLWESGGLSFLFVSRPPSRPSTSPDKNHRVDKKENSRQNTHTSTSRVVKMYRAKHKK